MYPIFDISKELRNPYKIVRGFYRLRARGDYYRSGIGVFEADMDTLIILSACRYNYFSDMVNLPGELIGSKSDRIPRSTESISITWKANQDAPT